LCNRRRKGTGSSPGGKIDRQEIAAIVDRFLAGKRLEPSASPLPSPVIESEAGSMYTAPHQSHRRHRLSASQRR
jgi:hypothetical protein